MRTRCLILFFLGLFPLLNADEQRVVSFSPALTELVFQLGKGDSLAGRSSVCNYPPEAKNIPVAGSFGDPELERTLRLRPTLVIANDLIRPALIKTFEKANINVILMQCRTPEDYCLCVKRLGDALGCPDRAEAEIRRMKECLAEFERKAEGSPLGKKVLWVVWDSPVMAAGKGSLPDTVIRLAGGKNIAAGVNQEYFKASYDWILQNPPDVIVWTASGTPEQSHPFWKQLDAVKEGRVVAGIDPDLIQRPGPRLPEGIGALRAELEKFR